jgi:hypothetical protein
MFVLRAMVPAVAGCDSLGVRPYPLIAVTNSELCHGADVVVQDLAELVERW